MIFANITYIHRPCSPRNAIRGWLRGGDMKRHLLTLICATVVISTHESFGQISISPIEREFTSKGGGGYILTVGTGGWKASTTSSWIRISPRTTGTAEQPCIYVVGKNQSRDGRDGEISINEASHKVIQYGDLELPDNVHNSKSNNSDAAAEQDKNLAHKNASMKSLGDTLDKFESRMPINTFTNTSTSKVTLTNRSSQAMSSRADNEPVDLGLRLSIGVGYRWGDYTLSGGGDFKSASGLTKTFRSPAGEQTSTQKVSTVLIQVDYNIDRRWSLGGSVLKNLSSDADNTHSSSWGHFYGSGVPGARSTTLDVKTDSETKFDMLSSDLYVTYSIITTKVTRTRLRLGYTYQSYEYELSNAHSTFPSSWSVNPPTYSHGTWMRDERIISYPYLQLLGSIFISENICISAGFGGSPLAAVEVTRSHVNSSAKSTMDLDGTAYNVFLEAYFKFSADWYIKAVIEGSGVRSDGKEKSYSGNQYNGAWDGELDSTQNHFALILGKMF